MHERARVLTRGVCLVLLTLSSVKVGAQGAEAPAAEGVPAPATVAPAPATVAPAPSTGTGAPTPATVAPAPATGAPTLVFGAEAAQDVHDTHQRLDRIYERLGRRSSENVDLSWLRCNAEAPEQEPLLQRAPFALPPLLGYFLVAVILGVVLLPLLIALSRYFRPSPLKERLAGEKPRDSVPVKHPWQVDLSACRLLVQQGRLIEAFAALHRATLLQLEEHFNLRLEHNTTNWEYVRALAAWPEISAVLAEVTRAAEQAVLGKDPPAAEHYWTLEQRVMQLRGAE